MLNDCVTHILNFSINSGAVPNIYKAAKITPILTSENHSLAERFYFIIVLPGI